MKTFTACFGLAWLSLAAVAAEDRKSVTATCHVCRYNRDLTCVEFRLKPTTPQLIYAGSSYRFCSEECRKAFLIKPERYIPKPKARTIPKNG